MSNKVYVLMQDLPTLNAVEDFIKDGKLYYYPAKYPVGNFLPNNGHGITFTENDVENNPEWFKLKEQSELEKAIELVKSNGYTLVKFTDEITISVNSSESANTVTNTIEPERITVLDLEESVGYETGYYFILSQKIDIQKFPEIIKAIESVVNDNTYWQEYANNNCNKVPPVQYNTLESFTINDDYLTKHDLKWSDEDMRIAIEKCLIDFLKPVDSLVMSNISKSAKYYIKSLEQH